MRLIQEMHSEKLLRVYVVFMVCLCDMFGCYGGLGGWEVYLLPCISPRALWGSSAPQDFERF
jgi:hypothetical protein